MAKVQANTELLLADSLQIADQLKALIFVSAAAILSKAQEDIAANAQLVEERLEGIGGDIDGIRNALSNKTGVGFAAKLKGQVQEVDEEKLLETLGFIDFRLERYSNTFWNVIGSKERAGYEDFVDNLGLLGATLQVAIAQVSGGKIPNVPFYFEAVLEGAMKTLSEED